MKSLIIVTLLAFGAVSAAAQPAPRPEPPVPPAAPAVAPQAPRPPTPPTVQRPPTPAVPVAPAARRGQPFNVRVEVIITDQHGPATPLKKTVTAVIADEQRGYIRSSARVVGQPTEVPLNVDIAPIILSDNKVRVNVSLEYDLPSGTEVLKTGTPGDTIGLVTRTGIRENLTLILESGKPIVAAQSADPISDRQVSIEVRATILR